MPKNWKAYRQRKKNRDFYNFEKADATAEKIADKAITQMSINNQYGKRDTVPYNVITKTKYLII